MRVAFLVPLMSFASSLALASSPVLAAEKSSAEPVPAVARPPAVATVNGRAIGADEYEQALAAAVRARFYHRTPPDAQMAALRREVVDSLVELRLAAAQAMRRGIVADAAKIDRDLERIESRFRSMPGWAEHREPQVARWRAELEARARAEALEKDVRAAVSPTAGEVRRFYDANPALFTEPERLKIGVILLKVDPAAGKAARDRAREEATGIRQRIAKGADFAELAKIHSGDDTASKGGDMGFVHRGALPEPVQAVADKLQDGQVSDPIDVLEGIAIIRVAGRKAAEFRPYDAVRDRARELVRRKAADEAWKALVAKLRAEAKIEVDARRFAEVATAPDAAKASPPLPR